MKKKKSFKRDLIEWGIFLGIIALLYFTGLHTEVIGFMQRAVLKTGIIKPDMDTSASAMPDASYQLTLMNEKKEAVSMADMQGKTIFMNYWATWCPPCIAEMPEIQNLYEDLKNEPGIEFVLISLDDEPVKAWNFVEKKGYTFPVYVLASPLPSVYKSQSIPTSFVISPEGKIVSTQKGMASYDNNKFREFLLSL